MTAVATKPQPATCQDLFARYNAAWQALQAVCRDEPASSAHKTVHDAWWDRLTAANSRCNEIAADLFAAPAETVSDGIGKLRIYLDIYEGCDIDQSLRARLQQIVDEMAGLEGGGAS